MWFTEYHDKCKYCWSTIYSKFKMFATCVILVKYMQNFPKQFNTHFCQSHQISDDKVFPHQPIKRDHHNKFHGTTTLQESGPQSRKQVHKSRNVPHRALERVEISSTARWKPQNLTAGPTRLVQQMQGIYVRPVLLKSDKFLWWSQRVREGLERSKCLEFGGEM